MGFHGILWDLRMILINAKKKVRLMLLNLAVTRLRNTTTQRKISAIR